MQDNIITKWVFWLWKKDFSWGKSKEDQSIPNFVQQ